MTDYFLLLVIALLVTPANFQGVRKYPYHVAYGATCGGAILHAGWILTAAHCGSKDYIRFGSNYRNAGTKSTIEIHFFHPGWDLSKVKDDAPPGWRKEPLPKEHLFDFDILLLLLRHGIKFNENAKPISLSDIEPYEGHVVTVTSWGNWEENRTFSSPLRGVDVPVVDISICQQVFSTHFQGKLTPRMFCAGLNKGNEVACMGDSVAVLDGKLLGIVSFGSGCANPGSYGVYTGVSKVTGWINDLMSTPLYNGIIQDPNKKKDL